MVAEEKRSNKPIDLDQDEHIGTLVSDPSQIPDLKIKVGFLGKSALDRYYRLYLTLELSEYIDIPVEDVVHYHRFDSEQSPMGG